MADSERKIDEMFGLLHELKPVVLDIREGQKSMDERMRATETRGAEHGVKIDRLQEDVDGLGRKVRAVEVRATVPIAVAPPVESSGKWVALAEFIHALPAYWHVAALSLGWVLSVVAILWRHRP